MSPGERRSLSGLNCLPRVVPGARFSAKRRILREMADQEIPGTKADPCISAPVTFSCDMTDHA